MSSDEDFSPEAVTVLCAALNPVAPPASVWAAIEESIAQLDRFEPWVARLATLLYTSVPRARAYLQDIDSPSGWGPGPGPRSYAYPLIGGAETASAIVGFIKLEAGSTFPTHTHHGDEIVLVLQGTLRTSDGAMIAAGEEAPMLAGSTHSVSAEPGQDAIFFVRILGEVEIGGQRIGPDDFRL